MLADRLWELRGALAMGPLGELLTRRNWVVFAYLKRSNLLDMIGISRNLARLVRDRTNSVLQKRIAIVRLCFSGNWSVRRDDRK
jgi:hypothetical protein